MKGICWGRVRLGRGEFVGSGLEYLERDGQGVLVCNKLV